MEWLKELQRFKERGVYVRAPREEVMQDPDGKFVKTRWVQSVKGVEVRCRSVAEEFLWIILVKIFSPTPHLFSRQGRM